MNAYASKEEMALLPSSRISFPEHYADARRDGRGPVAGLVGRLVAAVRRHQVVSELNGLTDRELQDIGLNRSDIGRVFEPAFARR